MTTGLLITTAGQAAIAADLGGGADLVLSHVAFGDAGGVPYVPNAAQVALVNERYRATIASVAVVAGAIVIDAVIPADTPDGSARPSHGFSVAEAGLYSAAGTLIGVARMNNGYKPPPSTGQAQIATFRFKLAVANPSAITVVIDPQAQFGVGRLVRPFWVTVDGIQNAPPGAPAIGATYVIGAAPTGSWNGFAHRIAQWVGVWTLATVPIGHIVCDASKDEDSPQRFMRRAAAGWVSAAAAEDSFGLALLASEAEHIAALLTDKAAHPAGVKAMLNALSGGLVLPGNILVFPTSGIYTPSANMVAMRLRMVGGGAAGGVGDTGGYLGGGGGSGAVVEAYFKRADLGASEPVTIGGGGYGYPPTGMYGGENGGNTTFKNMVAGGGGGGGTGPGVNGPSGIGGVPTIAGPGIGVGIRGADGPFGARWDTPSALGVYGRGGSGGSISLGLGGSAGFGGYAVIEEFLKA